MTRRITSTGVSARSPMCAVNPALLTRPVTVPKRSAQSEQPVHVVLAGDVGFQGNTRRPGESC